MLTQLNARDTVKTPMNTKKSFCMAKAGTADQFVLSNKRMSPARALAATFIAAFLTCVGHGAVIYQQDFEHGVDKCWSGAGTNQTTGGLAAFGLGNYHLRSESDLPSVFTLTGLPPHTSMTLTFDLAMWDSIDYHDSCATCLDVFQISVDGVSLYNGYFGNYWGTPINVYGNSFGPGTPLTPDFTAYYAPDYGYGTFRDSARRVSYSFPHTSQSAVFTFQYPSSQGGVDESYGLDNVNVSVNSEIRPKLTDCALSPAGPNVFASISGQIAWGVPNAVAVIQASPDLGATVPWHDIGSVVLGPSGNASFGPYQDIQSAGWQCDFFRVVIR